MIDEYTLKECQNNEMILKLKIKSLHYGIRQVEQIIEDSKLNIEELTVLRSKIAQSIQDLELLNLIAIDRNITINENH